MVGSKDLPPSNTSFAKVFFHNQFCAKPNWPVPGTSLLGKTAIVSGGNTGLGYEASIQLLELKLSRLVLAVRSIERGEEAAAKLRKLHPHANIEVWTLDMSQYDSIQNFARRVKRELSRIDMVILNAGVIKIKHTLVQSTGHEEQLQVNYLSTAFLTILLLPILKSNGPPDDQARLTIVNAALSLAAAFPERSSTPLLRAFDDPQNFDQRETYNSTKLLAHMFLWNLVDHVSSNDVIVNLADPAWCKGTDLTRDVEGMGAKAGVTVFGALTGRTPKVGASCFVDAVVNKGKESHGCFLMSWNIHPFAAFLYTEEGRTVTQKVWGETLAEFEFAGVRSILESMRSSEKS